MPLNPVPVTIQGPSLAIGGNTAGVLGTITAGTAVFVGGNNITLSQAGQNVTISGAAGGGGGSFTLNGTTNSVSISAGANIGIGQAASTITISASNQTGSLSYVQSLNGSSGQVSLVAGKNISLSSNASTITINDTGSTLVSITSVAGGATQGTANTASSSAFAFVAGPNITL